MAALAKGTRWPINFHGYGPHFRCKIDVLRSHQSMIPRSRCCEDYQSSRRSGGRFRRRPRLSEVWCSRAVAFEREHLIGRP